MPNPVIDNNSLALIVLALLGEIGAEALNLGTIIVKEGQQIILDSVFQYGAYYGGTVGSATLTVGSMIEPHLVGF